MPVIVTENLNCALSSVLGCGMLSHVLNVHSYIHFTYIY